MGEIRSNRALIPRRAAATFMLALTGSSLGFIESAQSRVSESRPAITLQEKPRIILESQGDFDINGGIVSILKERGLNAGKWGLDFGSIKREIVKSSWVGKEQPVLPMLVGTETDKINLPVKLKNNREKFHGYMVLKTAAKAAAFAGYPRAIPAVTVLDLDKGGRVTYLAPVTTRFTNFERELDPNVYDLATETCNNINDVVLTQQAIEKLSIHFSGKQLNQVLFSMRTIGHEAVCNSYGLAVAAREAKVSYSRYGELVANHALQRTITGGLDVPYIKFPEKIWKQL